jgi:hypothetical protein
MAYPTISSIRESMIRGEDIPSWVPLSVKCMASVLPGDIRQRLLTDPRMEKVWQVLQRMEVNKSGLDSVDSFQRLRAWDIPEDGLSSQDLACAAFFCYAVTKLSSPPPVITRAQIEDLVKRYLDAAVLCRSPDYNLLPMTQKLSEVRSIAGRYLEDQARMWEQRTSPGIVERSSGTRGDDRVRICVRALATETHRLFGSFLYRTVATVVIVGLEIEPISAKSVENWCSGLPAQ